MSCRVTCGDFTTMNLQNKQIETQLLIYLYTRQRIFNKLHHLFFQRSGPVFSGLLCGSLFVLIRPEQMMAGCVQLPEDLMTSNIISMIIT